MTTFLYVRGLGSELGKLTYCVVVYRHMQRLSASLLFFCTQLQSESIPLSGLYIILFQLLTWELQPWKT